MQQRIMNVLNQIKGSWTGLDKGKQIRFVVSAIVLVLAIAGTVYYFTRPEMVMISNTMTVEELAQAVQILNDNGIKNEVTNNTTTLLVRQENIDQARFLLTTNNIESSEFTYEDALNVSIGTTSETRKQMAVLAKQTEIEHTLKMLNSVKNASVILSIPDTGSYIIRETDEPTASVVLEVTGDLTATQLESIATHVARSVTNLKLENVSIMDTTNKSLFQAGSDGYIGGMSRQQEQEEIKRRAMEEQVKTLLSQQYNIVDVVATLKFDWRGSAVSETQYSSPVQDSTQGLISSQTIDNSEVENTAPADEPGVGSNNGQTQYPTGSGESSSASSEHSQTEYLHNQITTQTTDPAVGKLDSESSSLAVRVYINRIIKEDDVREKGDLENTTWEDYQTNIRLSPVPLTITSDQTANAQMVSMIQTATGVQNVFIDGYERPMFEDSEKVTRPINQLLMAGLLLLLIALLAFGLIRRTQPVEITEFEPELSVEELLISSRAAQEQMGSGEQRIDEFVPEIDYFADSELKKQIDKFVDEKPEAAAQLLRNWLSEEWE